MDLNASGILQKYSTKGSPTTIFTSDSWNFYATCSFRNNWEGSLVLVGLKRLSRLLSSRTSFRFTLKVTYFGFHSHVHWNHSFQHKPPLHNFGYSSSMKTVIMNMKQKIFFAVLTIHGHTSTELQWQLPSNGYSFTLTNN